MTQLDQIKDKLKQLNDLIPEMKKKMEGSIALIKSDEERKRIKEELERIYQNYQQKTPESK